MAANQNELALRYLLALSGDIRSAVLLAEDGELLASAPHPADDAQAAIAAELLESALQLREGSQDPIELDLALAGSAVYLLVRYGHALVCVADRQSLPGIVLHEMRSVLEDISGTGGRSLREVGA